MSSWVDWDGKLFPATLFDPPLDLPRGVCTWCGGLGVVAEQIADDRLDVAVPCPHCRVYCKPCGQWVRRVEHDCDKPIPEEETLP